MKISHLKFEYKPSQKPQGKLAYKEPEDIFRPSEDRKYDDPVSNIKKLRQMSNSKKRETVKSINMDGYMIPANKGKITHLCLTYGISGYGPVKENYQKVFKTFLQNMPDARFTVLTSDDKNRKELQSIVDELASSGIKNNPERIKIVNTGQEVSIWAQDSTLVIGNKVIVPEREYIPDEGDKAVARKITRLNPSLKFENIEGLFIDGGNQLATEDKIFLGSDTVNFMMKDMKKYPSKYDRITGELNIKEAEKLSQEELCKLMLTRTFPHQKLVFIGDIGEGEKQPEAHIDLFMTPLGKVDPETGKEVITVGDPFLACKILDKLKENDPEKYAKYEEMIKNKIPNCHERHPLNTITNFIFEEIFFNGIQGKF